MRSLLLLAVFTASATASADTPPDLAAARAVQIQRLHDYRVAGAFPVDDTGMPLSVFRDAKGHLCPMAHLITKSGRGDLVDTVAKENNALRLADVTAGPLVDWILDSGLTREEVIMVQGAMSIDYDFEIVTPTPQMILAGKQEVSRRLAEIEKKLRADTRKSLATARERLPVPHVASTAPVVPEALVLSAKQNEGVLHGVHMRPRMRAAVLNGAPNARPNGGVALRN